MIFPFLTFNLPLPDLLRFEAVSLYYSVPLCKPAIFCQQLLDLLKSKLCLSCTVYFNSSSICGKVFFSSLSRPKLEHSQILPVNFSSTVSDITFFFHYLIPPPSLRPPPSIHLVFCLCRQPPIVQLWIYVVYCSSCQRYHAKYSHTDFHFLSVKCFQDIFSPVLRLPSQFLFHKRALHQKFELYFNYYCILSSFQSFVLSFS